MQLTRFIPDFSPCQPHILYRKNFSRFGHHYPSFELKTRICLYQVPNIKELQNATEILENTSVLVNEHKKNSPKGENDKNGEEGKKVLEDLFKWRVENMNKIK